MAGSDFRGDMVESADPELDTNDSFAPRAGLAFNRLLRRSPDFSSFRVRDLLADPWEDDETFPSLGGLADFELGVKSSFAPRAGLAFNRLLRRSADSSSPGARDLPLDPWEDAESPPRLEGSFLRTFSIS